MPEISVSLSIYAGFWRRVAAALADALLLIAALLLAGHALGQPHLLLHEHHLAGLIGALVALVYATAFESSVWQATPGKILLRLRVTDLAGQRLTPTRALLRHLAQALSLATLLVGFVMAAFTRRRQCLHDKLAGTLVVRRGFSALQVAQAPAAQAWSRWIVVAVISPLAASGILLLSLWFDQQPPPAVPATGAHYAARTQVTAALYYASDAMDQAEEQFQSGGDFTLVNIASFDLDAEALRTISALSVAAGSIHITFGGESDAGLHGHTLTLTPALDSEGNVAWVCGYAAVPEDYEIVHDDYLSLTDVEPALLPADCKADEPDPADVAAAAPGLTA
jgi:uncharacterized RDD family membrane protein YckC